MDYQTFYSQLFAPLEEIYGPIETDTIMPIIGFDAGGPLSFCLFEKSIEGSRTYISCELAVRPEQTPNEFGHYELMATSDDEEWVRSILSDIGRESFDAEFSGGHTLDIGAWVSPDEDIQGIVMEIASSVRISNAPYCVIRCIGVTRSELAFAKNEGVPALLTALKRAAIYPRTLRSRRSVL